ncbi:MAG: NADH-quinone oxidoreductase subunit L [Candidatus Carbobacillus sp.]|nr:NADH-quinone oxidoreductase subunit L [Candidatus Carbobacillus sp.]
MAVQLIWILIGAPLVTLLLLTLFGRLLERVAAIVATLLMGVAWIASLYLLWYVRFHGAVVTPELPWLVLGDRVFSLSFWASMLGTWMSVIVTTISLLVHIYSIGYMHKDARIVRYYQYLALFTGAMLALVLSPNLIMFYIFWELVGAASFLLIGFDTERPAARQAALKAFLVTRFGDIGLFIGIIYAYHVFGHLDIETIRSAFLNGTVGSDVATVLSLLLFLGAMGKSGQFPLHVWLPDAMEGPTPVSALIHAATMVAAGVYLVALMFPVFEASPFALLFVTWIGSITALMAAILAVVQTDMKKVLAYSTVSQLGYMMTALGLGSVEAAMYHLTTHAFFKALLFLSAGAVFALTGTYNLERMGGLYRQRPVLGTVFLIGTLALVGLPPLSGYFSKERILGQAFASGSFAGWILLITVFLTAFYMGRLFGLTFLGQTRGEQQGFVPRSMQWTLYGLVFITLLTSVLELDMSQLYSTFLGMRAVHSGTMWVAPVAVLLSLFALIWSYVIFVRGSLYCLMTDRRRVVYKILKERFFIDAFYEKAVIAVAMFLGRLSLWLDRYIVEGLVYASAYTAKGIGWVASRLNNGHIQRYTYLAAIFIVFLLVWILFL